MSTSFDFRSLFVFDLANNHQGNVEHAENIIRGVGEVARRQGVRAALKFQFRQLDTFVHAAHKHDSDNKHLPRFLATELKVPQFKRLFDLVRAEGMLTMCTPFDEESVDIITDMGFDIMKVASCSAKDWPLLEKIAEAGVPTIFSTGGLEISNIDGLVSFFDHRGLDYAIMHCVSIYPTPDEHCHLNQIEVLRERYPNRIIGWSTHEDPDDTVPVQIAAAKGAEIFERHVGLATADVKLNAYSSTPQQVDKWIAAYKKAVTLCGSRKRVITETERKSLDGLRRGVFARQPLKKDTTLGHDQVYFAMPYVDGQLDSGGWKEGIVLAADVEADGPILAETISVPANKDVEVIKKAIHEVKALLNDARVHLNSEFEIEYSHHYGLEKFREHGAVLINCINREYCKKIIVQLPGQEHPAHFHKLKEETFQILHGELVAVVDGRERILMPGDVCLVMPGVWHSFRTESGCVFEEVSTTHFNDDSVYKDPGINKLQRKERKTVVDHWGRFQLPERVGDKPGSAASTAD